MSTNYIYDEILNQAQRLTTDQQLRLLEELAAFIRQKVTTEPLHSVLEFEGMGKELWQGPRFLHRARPSRGCVGPEHAGEFQARQP